MPTLISPEYTPLRSEALQTTKELSESKMLALLSNAAWLEEALTGEAYNGQGYARANARIFNHTGKGSGAYLRSAHTLLRGCFRDLDDNTLPLSVDNYKGYIPVEGLLWSFCTAANFEAKTGGANYRRVKSWPFIVQPYSRMLRLITGGRCKSGSGNLYARLAVYEKSGASKSWRIAWSDEHVFSGGDWQELELSLDLDDDDEVRKRRMSSAGSLWHAALLLRVDQGSCWEVGDSLNGLATWPGFAVTSF